MSLNGDGRSTGGRHILTDELDFHFCGSGFQELTRCVPKCLRRFIQSPQFRQCDGAHELDFRKTAHP